MDTVPPPTPGTTVTRSVVREARAVVAESDPFDDPSMTEAERVVVEGILTPADLRLLLEIVRRRMWEEGDLGRTGWTPFPGMSILPRVTSAVTSRCERARIFLALLDSHEHKVEQPARTAREERRSA